MSINRHPAGTSVGGQWAPGAAGEVDMDLLTESPEEEVKHAAFVGSSDQRAIVAAEERALARSSRAVAASLREQYPNARYATFAEDDDFLGATRLDAVYDAENKLIADRADVDGSDYRAVEDFENYMEWGHVGSAFEYRGEMDPSRDPDDPYSGGSVVAMDLESPPSIPPQRIEPTPVDPMFAQVMTQGGTSWSPVVADDGSGYRRDMIEVHDDRPWAKGTKTPVEKSNTDAADVLEWYESRARKEGDFL